MNKIKDTFTYSSPSHAQLILSNLHSLLASDEYCDIRLSVQNQVFSSHRNVLSAASEYFHAMFSGGLSEMGKEEVNIEGISPTAFKIMLKYIYTGTVLLPPKYARKHCDQVGEGPRFVVDHRNVVDHKFGIDSKAFHPKQYS